MKLTSLKLLALASIALATTSQASTILFQDTFNTGSGNVNNRPIETPQTAGDKWWQSGGTGTTVNEATGTAEMAATGWAKIFAPYNGTGQSFSLSYQVKILAGNAGDENILFYSGLSEQNVFTDYMLAYGFKMTGNFGTGLSVNVDAGTGDTRQGAFTHDSMTLTRTSTSEDWEANFVIDVDATSGTVNYSMNGNLFDTLNVGAGNVGDIGGISGKVGNGNLARTITLDDFTIRAASVPEPSSTALLGLGTLGFLLRRRR